MPDLRSFTTQIAATTADSLIQYETNQYNCHVHVKCTDRILPALTDT